MECGAELFLRLPPPELQGIEDSASSAVTPSFELFHCTLFLKLGALSHAGEHRHGLLAISLLEDSDQKATVLAPLPSRLAQIKGRFFTKPLRVI